MFRPFIRDSGARHLLSWPVVICSPIVSQVLSYYFISLSRYAFSCSLRAENYHTKCSALSPAIITGASMVFGFIGCTMPSALAPVHLQINWWEKKRCGESTPQLWFISSAKTRLETQPKDKSVVVMLLCQLLIRLRAKPGARVEISYPEEL